MMITPEKQMELRNALGELQGKMSRIKSEYDSLLPPIPQHIQDQRTRLADEYDSLHLEWKETSDRLEYLLYG